MMISHKQTNEDLSKKHSRGFSKYLIGILVTLLCVAALFGSWSLVWAQKYDHRVAPNITINSVNMRGKSASEVHTWLQQNTDAIMTNGIVVRLNGNSQILPIQTLIGSDLIENVSFNLEETTNRIMAANHSTNLLINDGLLLMSLFKTTNVPVQFSLQTDSLSQTLHSLFITAEQPASDTTFQMTHNGTDWNVNVKAGVSGDQIDTQNFLNLLSINLSDLKTDPIELRLTEKTPTVTAKQAEAEIPEVKQALKNAPYILTHKDDAGAEINWPLSADLLATMIVPTPNGQINIDETKLDVFLDPIATQINRPAKDARFKIANGRVSEFAQSEDGQIVDPKEIYTNLLAAIHSSAPAPIAIATHVEKPAVTMTSGNNLGITNVLGKGLSSYKGSPGNRKKNIQNGMRLLNGLLIPPGETFSLLHALEPFTLENGYLSELVIKGTKIIPDIGGGLCQIGTTTFRTAMNSGLPIIERQNHSLVVGYYNDPSNNNPGTDASIFEPAPDFKFKNDTGHYILFETAILDKTEQLQFTFWGTSDGRKGSYTPPVVANWIPFGEQVTTETTDLKPGEEKCQDAHKGANTSFTYTVIHADGTKEEKVFTSHYRPLPKICAIGVDPAKIKEINNTQPVAPVDTVPLDVVIPN